MEEFDLPVAAQAIDAAVVSECSRLQDALTAFANAVKQWAHDEAEEDNVVTPAGGQQLGEPACKLPDVAG